MKDEILERTPFFSVIIPAHNAEKYISRGLNSIADQTFQRFELIVVCDACTDLTPNVVNTTLLFRNFPLKIIETSYHLDGMARNAGLDAARGKWVLFMDDDDWFMHEYVFQQLHDVTANTDADLITFGFIWKSRGYYDNAPEHASVAVWNKCWRREFIGKTRFPDTPYWSDVEFEKRIMEKKPRAAWLNMPMYYYNYLRPGSISQRKEAGEIE